MLIPTGHLCKVRTALREESSPQHIAERTGMTKGVAERHLCIPKLWGELGEGELLQHW